jgi:uncharacterized membrane protein
LSDPAPIEAAAASPAKPSDKLPGGPQLRLIIGVAVGVMVAAVLPRSLGPMLRALFGWDAAVSAFIVLILRMMAVATEGHMRRRAALQDQGRWVILAAIIAGAFASLSALAYIQKAMKTAAGAQSTMDLAVIIGTILLSWFLVHIVFTLHYAHAYYGPATDENDADGLIGGLDFPNEKQPDYSDFLYFSFVVGMTCQVSDVQVSERGIRRLTLLHGIVSFFFNTIILALTINIIAALI